MSTRTWPTELVPEFTYTWESKWQTVQTPFESGHVQSRATWPRPIRYWRPTWKITDATQALALDAFEVINNRLGAKPLAHWTVDLDHRDGSRLHFIDALLVSHENWIGCFTKNHGFFIYHNSDLVRYNCVPKKGKPCPSAKKL